MPLNHIDQHTATLSVDAAELDSQMPSASAILSSDEPADRLRPLAAARSNIYGSFLIEDTEFALPVDAIQEVVNEPKGYAPVPMSPPHLLGLFNLRGMIIPVIDLSILLEFSTKADAGTRKIAIIENGELCIGLLFDDTGEIVNSDGVSRVSFEENSNGLNDVVIEGVLKLDNGTRLVQLLNPYKILNLKRVPRASKSRIDSSAKDRLGPRLNCISFQVGHTQCAIDLCYIQEIINAPEIQTSPLAFENQIGNIELRGRTLPVIDFRGYFGNEPANDFSGKSLSPHKLLILNLPEGPIGLIVYSVDSIISYFQKEVLPFSNVTLPRHDIIEGCLVDKDGDIVILLDHENLIRDEILVNAAKSCQEIYPPETDDATNVKDTKTSTRKSFVLFSIEKPLALDISCVSEIINLPDNLLKPPYALDFVEGIIVLRGELITLINPRVLYNLGKSQRPNNKVLILQRHGKRYGVTVDAIDEIVNTTSGEFLDMPSFPLNDANRFITEDVVGCLSIPSRGPTAEPVMVLNIDALLARCVVSEG